MKNTKKCVESRQLHQEGYSQDSRVELEDNEKVHSVSLTFDRKQNGESVYERIICMSMLILLNRQVPNGMLGGVRGRNTN